MLMPTAVRVRVAHPEPLVHRGIVSTLHGDSRFQVHDGEADEVARPGFDAASPQVLVTDLPLGVAAALRAPARVPAVLVLSHLDGDLSIRHALERGVKGYLTHDCSPQQLVDAVMALARGQSFLQSSVMQRLAQTFSQDLPTPREVDVLRLMATGLCNKAIAAELNISCGTVKSHIRSLLSKLGAPSRTAAAAIAKRRGLLDHAADDDAPDRIAQRHGSAAGRRLHAPGHALA